MAVVSAKHDVQVEVRLGKDPAALEWEVAMEARRVARDSFCARLPHSRKRRPHRVAELESGESRAGWPPSSDRSAFFAIR